MAGPRLLVLGANGLIGNALAMDLQPRGFVVAGQARRFTAAQKAALDTPIVAPLLSLDDAALARLLGAADIVVNCVGILQGAKSEAVHHAFAARLAAVCANAGKLLIHFSVPGAAKDDRTSFSRTKRAGEAAIAASGAPFVILRPGFVVATAAYGGSALMRALAMLPFALPGRESAAPFAVTAMSDLCATVAQVSTRWRDGERQWAHVWEVMEQAPGTVGDVVSLLRAHLGGPKSRLRLPGGLMTLGAWTGDAVACAGWRPPIRTTAIREMRRGVAGDPRGWMTDTGLVPRTAHQAVMAAPVTVQERWFARLYLLKALALAALVLFWCASGSIALFAAFVPARAILLTHGFSFPAAQAITIVSSLMDIVVGLAIAVRRTSRWGLWAGVAVSLAYMLGAALVTPDLWFEPLGALVKTFPAIVLMLVCLAIRDER